MKFLSYSHFLCCSASKGGRTFEYFYIQEEKRMEHPLIDLSHIWKSYDGDLILDDLSLSVKENSFSDIARLKDNILSSLHSK